MAPANEYILCLNWRWRMAGRQMTHWLIPLYDYDGFY